LILPPGVWKVSGSVYLITGSTTGAITTIKGNLGGQDLDDQPFVITTSPQGLGYNVPFSFIVESPNTDDSPDGLAAREFIVYVVQAFGNAASLIGDSWPRSCYITIEPC